MTDIDGGAKLDVGSITNAEEMFGYCKNITSIDFTDFDSSNIISMRNIFNYNLKSINFTNFDTSKVTDMLGTFSEIQSTTLDLSNFDTSNVVTMNGIFGNCKKLTSLDLSNFDTSKVTNMDSMFYNCSALETLDYSLNGFSNNGIAPDLSSCTALKTLRLHGHGNANSTIVNNFINSSKVPSTCIVTLVD